MAQSLYQHLGVDKSASTDEIRKAYRKLARQYHPDVNPGNSEAENKFKEISAAFEVLSDDKRRKAYDEFGEESLAGGFDPEKARAYRQWKQTRSKGAENFRSAGGDFASGDFDLGDLFGFGAGRARGPVRGADARAVIDMDLRQALSGGEIKLEVPGQKPITVRIPPGADTGSTIVLAGKGEPGPRGGPNGDLIIETRVKPHPFIKREGLDLHMVVPVTLDEAYNGATIEIPTFEGPVKLKIPPHSQQRARLRLRGKGVPRKDQRGDLLVELDVKMPDRADERLAGALRDSLSAYSVPVRKEMRL